MSDSSKTENLREVFAGYVCDSLSQELLEAAAGKAGFNPSMVFKGGVAAAARSLGAMECPNILFLDLSDSNDPISDMEMLADVCAEDTIVIAFGTHNDVNLYRDLLATGVQDYLVKPVTAEALEQTLAASIELMNEEDEEEEGPRIIDTRQVVFIGTRGGLGTSQIACNTAMLFATDKINTSLLDLDVYFGTDAMFFNLEPGRGLADALENPARVDGLFLERAVVKPTEMLSIMAAESPFGLMPTPAKESVSHLINTMGEDYDAVIVDAPRSFLADNTDALEAATDIVVVTDFSLTSARDCIRILAQIKNHAPEAELHLVANRVGPVDEVQQGDFENSIEQAIDIIIHEDRKAVIAASHKDGVICLSEPNSKLAVGIKALYNRIMADDLPEEDSKSWFAKLLKKD